MEKKYFAIILETKEWFEKALSGEIDIANSPPNRSPKMGYLKEGDPVMVLTLKERTFVGELKFKEAREVNYDEFERRYRQRAYGTERAPFPSLKDKCWVMIFDDVRPYRNEVSEEDMRVFSDFDDVKFSFHRRGFQLLTQRYWDNIRERIKNLGENR